MPTAHHGKIDDIPSRFWPTFVETSRELKLGGEGTDRKRARSGTRAVLLRCEGSKLLLDFGRKGIHLIEPKDTDFYDGMLRLMKGESRKDFPNLTLQIGNKLMHFGNDETLLRVQMDDVKNTDYFIFIYLGEYSEVYLPTLYTFGQNYDGLSELEAKITAVVIPQDRTYYDFGYTVNTPIPFIFPHMRAGYMSSLAHNPPSLPYLVMTDSEGRVYHRSGFTEGVADLSLSVSDALSSVGINWEPAKNEPQVQRISDSRLYRNR